MTTRAIADYGINWIWYLEGDFDDDAKTVEIKRHYRIHKGEGGHPTEDAIDFRINEDLARTAQSVRVGNWKNAVTYTVTNPKNVFEYRSH